MLYKFKSKNAGDVIMLEPNGRRVLEIIGKDAGAQGIIQAAEIPAAISALQAAITEEESAPKEDGHAVHQHESVGLRQRAQPFIEMLKQAQSSGDDIVWGV